MSSDVLFNKISKFYQSNQNCQKFNKLLYDNNPIKIGRKVNINIIQSKLSKIYSKVAVSSNFAGVGFHRFHSTISDNENIAFIYSYITNATKWYQQINISNTLNFKITNRNFLIKQNDINLGKY